MPKFLSEIQLVATSSIETPDPGFVTLYVNTDGNLYAKTSNGNQVKLNINNA
jgi:hypothetical protein